MFAHIAWLVSISTLAHSQNARADMLDHVDPLIGTTAGGHVFPGASLPFGMAKAVADVNSDERQGGFASDDGEITGFSQMHDSGTGGGYAKGNFAIFPHDGCPGDDVNNCAFPKALRASKRVNASVQARPGYFAVALNTSVHTEVTVTNHTALYRITFPAPASTRNASTPANATSSSTAPRSPLILVDLTDLADSRTDGSASVEEYDDASAGGPRRRGARITGNGTFTPSFGIGSYALHFCADFRGGAGAGGAAGGVRDSGVFHNNRAGAEPKTIRTHGTGATGPVPAGAWVRFHPSTTTNTTTTNQSAAAAAEQQPSTITVRVGLSYISAARACDNAEREIGDFDFDATRRAAEAAWRARLGVVAVREAGVGVALLRTFWSGLYRSLLSPQDVTGENPLWSSAEPYYDSFYCIWDSYRSIHPLLTLVDPLSQTRMVRSLIDVYRFEGWLPDCRMDLCKGYTQGGSNADVVLADTFVKGFVANDIDWATAYDAVVKDAEVEPPVWSVEGRGGLASWKRLGYIPADDFDTDGVGPFTRSISRTVEYAYDDFAIALMARGLNRTADAERYAARSGNWINLYKDDQPSFLNLSQNSSSPLVDSGFTGFLMPRYLNQTFGFQDPALCSNLLNFTSCYLNADGHETYEGSSWLYTLYAPHDMARLIATLGGPDAFVARVRYLHDTPGLNYIGDEQAFLTLYLFHYAGRPALSSLYRHAYIPRQFNASVNGLPGNDDSGAMGSFVALSMMGLWPVSGQDVYLITPPFFREVNVSNPLSGRTATVRCVNFDGDAAGGYRNIYVQSATLNGVAYTRSWIGHSFYRDGGVLELTLGANESSWGTRDEDLPPSLSTGGFGF